MNEDRALIVHIVDDDPAVRDSLALLLSLRGYTTASFACAEDFLAAVDPDWAGCIMADMKMPGMNGLEMQSELASRGIQMPVVVMTAHGSVGIARQAFKNQAIDFLEKPFDEDGPVEAVEAAFTRERARLDVRETANRRDSKLATLTERERQVVDLLLQGLHHTEIGTRLGIGPRTVEVHKARIMAKLDARSVAELVRITLGRS